MFTVTTGSLIQLRDLNVIVAIASSAKALVLNRITFTVAVAVKVGMRYEDFTLATTHNTIP